MAEAGFEPSLADAKAVSSSPTAKLTNVQCTHRQDPRMPRIGSGDGHRGQVEAQAAGEGSMNLILFDVYDIPERYLHLQGGARSPRIPRKCWLKPVASKCRVAGHTQRLLHL